MPTGRKVFVACNAEDCPLNDSRQCRASSVLIDQDGSCIVRSSADVADKSETEGYVDVACDCQSCNYWEEDQLSGQGLCGLCEDLFFQYKRRGKDRAGREIPPSGPFCHVFENQIEEPPSFSTNI